MIRNWRYRIGLFLTGMAVGCGLLLDVSLKQAFGIALIGVTLSWLIGDLAPRVLGFALAVVMCAVGLYLAASPVWSEWESAQKSAAEYDVAIDGLQTAVKNAPILDFTKAEPVHAVDTPVHVVDPIPLSPTRIVKIPGSTLNWLRPEEPGPWEMYRVKDQRSFPQSMSDAEIMHAFESSLLLPRPTFSLGSAIRAHAWAILGGLALFASGPWILGWSLRRIRIGIEQQGSSCIAS